MNSRRLLIVDDDEELLPPPPNPPVEPEPDPEPDPEPEFEELAEPLTCWPTARLTLATTPVIGEVSAALVKAAWAELSWPWAAATEALSAANWVAVPPALVSAACLAWSVASAAAACATVAFSAAESTVASTWPAVTFCPAVTATLVTRPDTAKFSASCTAGSMVPVELRLCRIVPVLAATNR